jgi:hypothetical protein
VRRMKPPTRACVQKLSLSWKGRSLRREGGAGRLPLMDPSRDLKLPSSSPLLECVLCDTRSVQTAIWYGRTRNKHV